MKIVFTKTNGVLFFLALAITFLNTLKPLHVDDTAYFYYAQQIAAEPADPYGHSVFWYTTPLPANEILAPPAFLYWWGLGIRLFGMNPVAWKWWLLPIVTLFVFVVHQLFRRFARDLAMPLTVLTVTCPAFLPAWNLMLDLPALTLSLSALLLFMNGAERRSWWRVLLAGVVAGVAIQTKYTGFLTPVAMALFAATHRSMRWWPLALVGCAVVVVGWEAFTACTYGESHFLFNYRISYDKTNWPHKFGLVLVLISLPGSILPAIVLLGLTATSARRRWSIGVVAYLLLSLVAVALVDVWIVFYFAASDSFFAEEDWVTHRYQLAVLLFGALGVLLWVVVGTCLGRLCRLHRIRPQIARWQWRRHRAEWFLLLWLSLELGGYFVLTPFPAVRRLMGVALTLTLIVARLASFTRRSSRHRCGVWATVVVSVLLGLLYSVVDVIEARAQRDAVLQAKSWIDNQTTADGAQRTTWFIGHWGMQFYAEREGMKPLIPGYGYSSDQELPPSSLVKKGDWLIVPAARVARQRVDLPSEKLNERHVIVLKDRVPFETIWCYYGGFVGLRHHQGPRFVIEIYQAEEDFIANSDDAAAARKSTTPPRSLLEQ